MICKFRKLHISKITRRIILQVNSQNIQPERYKGHQSIYRNVMLLFIISLGLGDYFKIFSVRILYLVTLALIILSVNNWGIGSGSVLNAKYRKMIKFGFFWLIYSVITLVFAVDFSLWIHQYKTLLLNFLVVYLMVKYIKSVNDWMWIAKCVIFLLVVMVIVGFWEICTGNHIHFFDSMSVSPRTVELLQNAPFTFYGNINDNGSALFMCTVIMTLYVVYNWNCLKYKEAYFILGFCAVYQMFKTSARGVVYSLPLLLAFIFFFRILLKFKRSQSRNLYIGIIVAIIYMILLALMLHSPGYYLSLLKGKSEYVSSGNYDSDLFRLGLIWNSFLSFIHTLGLGLGPGQSIIVDGINLHNFYFEVLFEYGFVGGYFIYQIFKLSFIKKTTLAKNVDAMIMSMPYVLILLGLSSSHFFSIKITWVFLTLLFCLKYGDFDKNKVVANENERILYNI